LPVSTISTEEVLGEAVHHTLKGAGVCVGRVLAENEVRIVEPVEGALAALGAAVDMPAGEIGEIIVRGPTVTAEYDGLPEATAGAKIRDEATGVVWHRMGDLGYLDAQGWLWFCGRKVETVWTERGPMYPAQAEPIFEMHAEVRRCALVSLNVRGRTRPAIVVEPVGRKAVESGDCRRLARELRLLALEHPATAGIKTFFFKERLPVDVRHNAKIHRLTLTRWVNEGDAVGFESDPKR
jgi:olefin beta-lactone synthetase